MKLKILLAAIVLFQGFSGMAQSKKDVRKAEIMTSAVCGMCKDKIEAAFKDVDGVMYAFLDVKTKKVKVKYDNNVIQLKDVKSLISMTGYDADDVKADPEAYDKLHFCCKKDAH